MNYSTCDTYKKEKVSLLRVSNDSEIYQTSVSSCFVGINMHELLYIVRTEYMGGRINGHS